MNIETLERWMWLLGKKRLDELERELHQAWLDEVRRPEPAVVIVGPSGIDPDCECPDCFPENT